MASRPDVLRALSRRGRQQPLLRHSHRAGEPRARCRRRRRCSSSARTARSSRTPRRWRRCRARASTPARCQDCPVRPSRPSSRATRRWWSTARCRGAADRASRMARTRRRSVEGPAPRWYLAEGATHSGFDLFYLLQNPNASVVWARIRYLRPTGEPLEKVYALPPRSRTSVWVDQEVLDGTGARVAGQHGGLGGRRDPRRRRHRRRARDVRQSTRRHLRGRARERRRHRAVRALVLRGRARQVHTSTCSC